jgi:hypothetical protein
MRPSASAVDRLLFLVAASCVMVSVLVAVRLLLVTRTGTVDSYYYFARAASLNEGQTLADTRTNWGDGVDRKFFPGYPLALHATALGSVPERSWRTLALLQVLVNPLLIGFALRRLGLSFGAACAAVAMFATSFISLNWMTMPMAEGTALFWLGLGICVMARRGEPLPRLRFLVACALCGMAILCRPEAAFPAAAVGLVGVARLRGHRGWLAVAVAGALLGIAPFGYWVSSLPPLPEGTREASRLHYVNEFLREFSWLDRPGAWEGGKGGFLPNFLRSWKHPVNGWGLPLFLQPGVETPGIATAWLFLWLAAIAAGLLGMGGRLGVVFACAYLGFVVFRSFWYYPYERFLVVGLPMGFAAAALAGEGLARHGRIAASVVGILFVAWVGRGLDNILLHHRFYRWGEMGTHSYADEDEMVRLRRQLEFSTFPVESPDIADLAARRFSRNMAQGNVALEFPWPQVCYAFRPRHVTLGWPYENFWGDAEYRWIETVPEGSDGKPVRAPMRALDFLRSRRVRYVVTGVPLHLWEAIDENDKKHGAWLDVKGIEESERPRVKLLDVIHERTEFIDKPQRPRLVRILRID